MSQKICSLINNVAAGCQILLKFRNLVQYASAKAAEWLESTYGQIQNAGRRPKWNFEWFR